MKQQDYSVPNELAFSNTIKPNYNVTFSNSGGEVGRLDFNGPSMIFDGNAEESAKVFFDWIAQSFEKRLEEERKAELERCKKVLMAAHELSKQYHNYYHYIALQLDESLERLK